MNVRLSAALAFVAALGVAIVARSPSATAQPIRNIPGGVLPPADPFVYDDKVAQSIPTATCQIKSILYNPHGGPPAGVLVSAVFHCMNASTDVQMVIPDQASLSQLLTAYATKESVAIAGSHAPYKMYLLEWLAMNH